jgi:hypothetical protein
MSAASKVSVIVGRELRGRARWPVDVQDRIAAATRVLDAVGERLRAGDRIITGSIVQVPVTVGDRVQAVFGDYATIGVEIVGDAGG